MTERSKKREMERKGEEKICKMLKKFDWKRTRLTSK
jgi:hypothetical protein